MRSQLRIDLRGKDPTTLEVILPDAFSMPIGQLAPATVCDMIALGNAEDVPKRLASDLKNFEKRILAEITDMPSGPLHDLVKGLTDVPGERVPPSLRSALGAELGRDVRTFKDRAVINELLTALSEVEAEPFVLGKGSGPRVTRTAQTRADYAAKNRERLRGPNAPERERKAREPSGPTRSIKTVVVEDPERSRWIRHQVAERLASYGEKGLSEMVLVAGIKHAARAKYPDLGPPDINAVLKGMKDSGKVRYSAGRWSLPGRW